LNRKRTLSRISNLLLNYTIQDLLFMLLLNWILLQEGWSPP
jgi:hypothetical protein